MPLVSIIVPCFNVEMHIEKTINSLTSQSYSDIEIILVDDGSKAELKEIIRSYVKQDKRIKTVRHKTNQGLSNSRNTGLKHSTGEYVLFWDSDDYLNSNTIEVLVTNALKNSSQVVRGVLARTDGMQRWITKRGRRLLKNKPHTSFGKSPELAMDFTSCGVLFSKLFLDKHGLAFEPNLYMQDILFSSNILVHANEICMCDHIVGEYFQSAQSASKLRSAERFQSLFILYEKLELLFKHQKVLAKQKELLLASFINAGVNTFLLWKLENCQKNTADLDRLSALLESIGEAAINQYCMDMFDEPSFLRLHATRLRNYKIAASVSQNTNISPDDLNQLFGRSDNKKSASSNQFLNHLRAQRKVDPMNSRLVLKTEYDALHALKLFLKGTLTWIKSKLFF